MALAGQRGAVLIVVMNRDDRRVLFEALDSREFDAIYTAKDFQQAHALLRQEPRLDAILLEFQGAAEEAWAFCSELELDERTAELPVIGIAGVDDLREYLGSTRYPQCVTSWLRSPVLGEEALYRIEALLRPPAPTVPDGPAQRGVAAPDFRFAFEASFDELVLSDPATGLILEVNPRFEEATGIPRSAMLGRPVDTLDLTHGPAERQAFRARAIAEGKAEYRCEKARSDGSRYWVDARVRMVERGSTTVWLTSFHEIPAMGRESGALDAMGSIVRLRGADLPREVVAELEQRFLNAHIWVVAANDEEGRSPEVLLRRISGTAPEHEPNWRALLDRVADGSMIFAPAGARGVFPEDPAFMEMFLTAIAVVPMTDERSRILGALVLAGSTPFPDNAGTRALLEVAAARIGFARELYRAREQGRANGLRDSLTGLPNRLLFNDRLLTTLTEAQRTGETFAVLFADLDRFKNINDGLGHGVGDEVLVAASKRLRSTVRGSDTVARYAGDEFTLILRHIVNRDDVLRVAEKMCRVLESAMTLTDGRELHITASIGISFYPDDATTADKLLQHADVAMYSAKGMGRNTFQTYVAVPEESHQQRLALEAKLRQAEKSGQLRVFFQPQVAAATEDIVGMEALIRWEHPELGMISPGFFIPLAEETGLILPIGEWILRQACQDARRWQNRFGLDLRVSVNLSALQLRQPNLCEIIASALADADLPAELLELEVTESLNVKSIPNLLETLQAVRDLGCSIAIDDFGTGQSSLDYIRRFPADRIKIDQVFVRNIGVDPDDEAIVRATLSMAHNLNLSVVAEGVEFEEHFAFLREHGCEELQGYLFARPLPAATFENLLAERERLMLAATG